MPETGKSTEKRLQVGEFARTVGKTVRALHLYEELGLLLPVGRSKGGFRLYDQTSVERAKWIVKLQGIGFTLAQIQGFVEDFDSAKTGQAATSRAGQTFRSKLDEVREQIAKLQSCESDLVDALAYLDGCRECEREFSAAQCHECTQNEGEAPELVAGLSEGRNGRAKGERAGGFHVNAKSLHRHRVSGQQNASNGLASKAAPTNGAHFDSERGEG